MGVLYERCCGLDVHKKTVVACALIPQGKEIRTFSTMTEDLLQLADWLQSLQVSHMTMESTGPYWKPIYNLLESEFQLTLVNAHHIKVVPGRKTDVKDAEWIADLLRHGLIKASYVPDRSQRELRELLRYRRSLIKERTREVNRIQKVLAGMAKGRFREKHADLVKALQGLVGPHQRMIIKVQMEHLDFLDKQIAKLDEEVSGRMGNSGEAIENDALSLAGHSYLPSSLRIFTKARMLSRPTMPTRR